MRRGQEETRAGVRRRVFKRELSRLAPQSPRRRCAATARCFLPFRLDRRDPVAGGAFVNVEERVQSDPGQLSDLGRTYPADVAARRQNGL